MIEKVERNGKIAVLYSPGYGSGWSTMQCDEHAVVLLFHPKIVNLVEQDKRDEITEELCKEILGLDSEEYVCTSGADDLEIEWVREGYSFKIDEYDGNERIIVIGYGEYHQA